MMEIAPVIQFAKNFIDLTTPLLAIPIGISVSILVANLFISVWKDTKTIIPNIEIETELKSKAKDHDYGQIEEPDYGELIGFNDEGEMIFEDKK